MEGIFQAFQDFVTFNGWGLFATLVNTLITYLIIKKFLYKPVKNMIASREQEVKTLFNDAEVKKTEAEKMHAEYEKHLSGAKEEAAEIVRNGTKKATVRSEEILKEASEQAAGMLKKAEGTIEQEKKKALNEIKDEISGMAVMIASKVVEKDIKEADHKRLIEDFINKVG